MTFVATHEQVVSARHGVLNINKPPGWTSHDVVAKLRGVLRGAKIGHGGTLDPAATGVLPILIGRATRIAEYLLAWDKEYEAIVRLGESTDTLDATGAVVARRAVTGLTADDIVAVMHRYVGTLAQVPPMYSAVKVGGVPLYKSARAGKTVERNARPVTIHGIEIMSIQGADVAFRVRCSKGTYIRSLCADIGEELGVGGHLLALQRTRVGPLQLRDSVGVDQAVDAVQSGRLPQAMLSLNDALGHLPVIRMDKEAAARAGHGASVHISVQSWCGGQANPEPRSDTVRVLDEAGDLVGVGTVRSTNEGRISVKLDKVLAEMTNQGVQAQ